MADVHMPGDLNLWGAASAVVTAAIGSWFVFKPKQTETILTAAQTEQKRVDDIRQGIYDDRVEEIGRLTKKLAEVEIVLEECRTELRRTRTTLDRQVIITERQEIIIDQLMAKSEITELERTDILRIRQVRPD